MWAKISNRHGNGDGCRKICRRSALVASHDCTLGGVKGATFSKPPYAVFSSPPNDLASLESCLHDSQ